MALGTFRPGVYTATYNGLALGIMQGDGAKLKYRRARTPVNNTNLYGDTLIDGIHRGYTGVQLLLTCKEWNAAAQSALWPFGSSTPVFDGVLQHVGELDSAYAKPLVLTAAVDSPAAGVSSGGVAAANTFTANLALLAPENDLEFLFGPVEPDVPLLFDLFPYDDSGTKRFFKWSNVP